ncbi:relaxase/mobilization nuclease domain-containing protein, partial [Clostridioides difficile]
MVCTHVDKHHVHNHIIINSTALDCRKKFRNFWGSTWAIRRDLAGLKRLPEMVGDHIIRTPATSGQICILPLGKKKLRIR